MIRLALLGAGRIGQVHARNAASSDAVELVSVTDAIETAAAGPESETRSRPRRSLGCSTAC